MGGEHRRADSAGVNRVDADVVAPEFQRRRLGQPTYSHLLATYAASPKVAVKPAPEEMLTTRRRPPYASRTPRRGSRYEPVRLISSTWRQTAGSVSSITPARDARVVDQHGDRPKASSAAATVAASPCRS